MGLQWEYLWLGLVLTAALALGLGTVSRFLHLASLGERTGVAEGASLRQVVVEYSDDDGYGSHESSEPALLAGLFSLLTDIQLCYDGLTDGGVPASPAAYTITVYPAPVKEGHTSGVDSQGCVYQNNRRYSASLEQAEELTALLERICS